MKPALLFMAGFLMEAVWAVGTWGLQQRAITLSFAMAAVAPYIATMAQAWMVVDETDLKLRLRRITWYAVGAICGLAATLPLWGK